MNNHLLIGLLALQAVSGAYAFDPGFCDVEYTPPSILQRRINNAYKELNIGRKYFGDMTWMELEKEWAIKDDIKNMKAQLEAQKLGISSYNDVSDPRSIRCAYQKYRRPSYRYQQKPFKIGLYRPQQKPFTTRFKNWLSNWYK